VTSIPFIGQLMQTNEDPLREEATSGSRDSLQEKVSESVCEMRRQEDLQSLTRRRTDADVGIWVTGDNITVWTHVLVFQTLEHNNINSNNKRRILLAERKIMRFSR
jgi:hypothetical protein